jgi:DNA polymerase-4
VIGSSAIFYAEVPAFYAEIERLRDPLLRERPVIVGGDPRKRGRVQSASPEAISVGVEVGMEMRRALACCPRARTARTDMAHYREVSNRLRSCFQDGSRAMEPLGLDAAYLESPEALEAVDYARSLRERVRERLGLPLRVGVSALKFLARLAAEEAGPEGILAIAAGEEAGFLHPLPVSKLPGVGPRTLSRLRDLGVGQVGDLLGIDPGQLEATLGNHGLRILELARGEDHGRVDARPLRQSLSREIGFPEPEIDRGTMDEALGVLARELCERLEREGWVGHRVGIRLSFDGGGRTSRTRSLGRPLSGRSELVALTSALLGKTQAGTRAVRRLGLVVSQLEARAEADSQLDLFGPAGAGGSS